MPIGIEFGTYNNEAFIVDLLGNGENTPLAKLCLNKEGIYKKEEVIRIVKHICKTYNLIEKLRELL